MLNKQEKKEMLADAQSVQRKADFRKTRVENSDYSLDSYLKFLDSVHQSFASVTPSNAKSISLKFKL